MVPNTFTPGQAHHRDEEAKGAKLKHDIDDALFVRCVEEITWQYATADQQSLCCILIFLSIETTIKNYALERILSCGEIIEV